MLKCLELSDPHSCLNRANNGEKIFVLLARDESTPATIRFWVGDRLRRGKNTIADEQTLEALDLANAIESEQREKVRLKARTFKIEYADNRMITRECFMMFKTDLVKNDFLNTLEGLGCHLISVTPIL